jgi:uncharacterized protein DUF4349
MRRFQVLLLAVFLLGLGACKKEVSFEAAEEAPAAPEAARSTAAPQTQAAGGGPAKAAPATAPIENRAPAIPRKLIRTVDLTLEVSDTQDAASKIQTLVSGLGGYVGASNGQRRGELMYYTLTVRVPVDRLDTALSAIRALAVRVDREHSQIEDVTDQYIDLDARMRTLEATETELRALLAESRQRARKVDEIMAVYQQLIEVRSQIEQIRTQLNSFDKLAAFSTLNLELVPTEAAKPVVAGGEWRPGDTVRSSARMLMALLRGLTDTAIFLVIVLLPVGLLVLAVAFSVRWVLRRFRRRPAEVQP